MDTLSRMGVACFSVLLLVGCGSEVEIPKTHLDRMGLQGNITHVLLEYNIDGFPGDRYEFDFNSEGMITKQTFYVNREFDGYATFEYDDQNTIIAVNLYDKHDKPVSSPAFKQPEIPHNRMANLFADLGGEYTIKNKDHLGNWTERHFVTQKSQTLADLSVGKEGRTITYAEPPPPTLAPSDISIPSTTTTSGSNPP